MEIPMFRFALAIAALVALQQFTLPAISPFFSPDHAGAEEAVATSEEPASRALYAQTAAAWTDGMGAIGVGPF